MTRAVVFAYHNVGARCLRVLRAHGVDVPLVVTHEDDPAEAHLVRPRRRRRRGSRNSRGSPRPTPNLPDVVATHRCPRAGFHLQLLLPPHAEAAAARRWRRAARSTCTARCCRSTGAARRSTGPCSTASGIPARRCTTWPTSPMPATSSRSRQYRSCPDDTAKDVFDKVTVAAEICLDAVLPALLMGTAPRRPQRPRARLLFRRAQARGRPHRLVAGRADRPQPGARRRTALPRRVHDGCGHPARVLRTRVVAAAGAPAAPALAAGRGSLVAHCGGGGILRIDVLEIDGTIDTPAMVVERFGDAPLPLGEDPGAPAGSSA